MSIISSNFNTLSSSRRSEHGITAIIITVLLSAAATLAGAQSSNNNNNQDNNYPYAKFSPSMAIIIVVLIAALFFMGFFSIYIRHCNENNSTGNNLRPSNAIGTGRSRRGNRGLDAAVIETFPTLVYSVVKNLKIGKGALECAVCLNEFEDNETLRLIPKCDHVFHPDCIDAWLGTHTTCPVCRANLVPQPGESVHAPNLNIDANGEESDDESVRADIEAATEPEVINPSQSVNQNRPPRSKSVRQRLFGMFPRSHSTGHSLVRPGENCERFTLRLPDEVRKQIVNGKLNRTMSCVVLPREGSSRRGYRATGEGSSRGGSSRRLDRIAKSDRWVFSMAPPFFARASSMRSPKVVATGEEGSVKGKSTAVEAPSDSLGAKGAGAGKSSAGSSRPPVV